MIQKKWIVLALISILIGVGVVIAAEIYTGNQTATGVGLAITLEDTPLKNGDTIAWGELAVGETYYWNLSVTNNYDMDYIICFLCPDLPNGWVETWDCNNTALSAGQSMWGWLNLTLSTFGLESWSWQITYTAPP